MKLSELNNYVLHDSGILNITKNDTKVTFEIMYCLFMQGGYKEGDPENAKVELTFNDVKEFSSERESYDSDEILEIKVDDDNVTFVVEDFNHETYNIKLKASSFDFNIVETINILT